MRKFEVYEISVSNSKWCLEIDYDETNKSIVDIVKDIEKLSNEISSVKILGDLFDLIDEINRLCELYDGTYNDDDDKIIFKTYWKKK